MNIPQFEIPHSTLRFNGLRVVENPLLIEIESESVKRTWVERLFSLSPWRSHKHVTKRVPSKYMYKTKDTIVMHPEAAKKLRQQLDKEKNCG